MTQIEGWGFDEGGGRMRPWGHPHDNRFFPLTLFPLDLSTTEEKKGKSSGIL